MNENTQPSAGPPALFQDNSQELMARSDAAAVARATQEIQAALVIAQRYTRDDIKAKTRILQACQRKELAEVSEYEYSRGGTRITGPTIDLLRAIANRWGNLRFGWTEVDRRDGMSSVRCFAWDLQSNSQAERTFTVRHWRDKRGGGEALEDERDIYELLANQAARRVRACLEEVIDSDIVMAAVEQCRRTMRDGEKVPISDRAAQIVLAFLEFGVTKPMIEARIGNAMDAVSENQIASLRRVYKSLKDGVGKREDYFKGEAGAVTEPKFDKPKEQPAKATEERGGFQPLKALRKLALSDQIPPGKVLEFLAQTGSTDGSVSSFDELAVSFPAVLALVVEQWSDIAAKIKAARKEAS